MSEHEQAFQQWLNTEQGQAASYLNGLWRYRIDLNDVKLLQPAIQEALAQAFEAGHQAGSAT